MRSSAAFRIAVRIGTSGRRGRRDPLARRRTSAGRSSRPSRSGRASRSRVSFEAPRSRTVVTPVSSVRRALSCARKTVTAGTAPLSERPRAGRAVPVVGHVRVEIDQARDAGVAAKVDHLGPLRQVAGSAADTRDPIAFDDEDRVLHDTRPVPELSEADDLRLRGRRISKRENQEHDHRGTHGSTGGQVMNMNRTRASTRPIHVHDLTPLIRIARTYSSSKP